MTRAIRAVTTVSGVATVASPTSGTWSVDYSTMGSPISLTGLSTSAANAIILTASATKAMIGNGLQITGGTNFTTGIYSITAVTAATSITVDRTCTTAAGASGTCGIGAPFASPGIVASGIPAGASSVIFLKYNAAHTALDGLHKRLRRLSVLHELGRRHWLQRHAHDHQSRRQPADVADRERRFHGDTQQCAVGLPQHHL